MFIGVLPACMCVEGFRSPGTRVTDRCELPCGFWKLNPSPLEEQPVILTDEPFFFFKKRKHRRKEDKRGEKGGEKRQKRGKERAGKIA